MKDWLTIGEWCNRYQKDPGNVRRLITAGRIPAEKVGKTWLIPEGTEPPEDLRKKGRKRGELFEISRNLTE